MQARSRDAQYHLVTEHGYVGTPLSKSICKMRGPCPHPVFNLISLPVLPHYCLLWAKAQCCLGNPDFFPAFFWLPSWEEDSG